MVSSDVLRSINQYIKHKHLLRSETQPETSRKDETAAEEAKEVFPFLKHGVNILSFKEAEPHIQNTLHPGTSKKNCWKCIQWSIPNRPRTTTVPVCYCAERARPLHPTERSAARSAEGPEGFCIDGSWTNNFFWTEEWSWFLMRAVNVGWVLE